MSLLLIIHIFLYLHTRNGWIFRRGFFTLFARCDAINVISLLTDCEAYEILTGIRFFLASVSLLPILILRILCHFLSVIDVLAIGAYKNKTIYSSFAANLSRRLASIFFTVLLSGRKSEFLLFWWWCRRCWQWRFECMRRDTTNGCIGNWFPSCIAFCLLIRRWKQEPHLNARECETQRTKWCIIQLTETSLIRSRSRMDILICVRCVRVLCVRLATIPERYSICSCQSDCLIPITFFSWKKNLSAKIQLKTKISTTENSAGFRLTKYIVNCLMFIFHDCMHRSISRPIIHITYIM